MNEINTTYPRITVDPGIMAGAPCIRGRRIPVVTLLRDLAGGATAEGLMADFDLEVEDVAEALQFAADVLAERFPPRA